MIWRGDEPNRRGYLLQDLLNRLFDLHEVPVYRSFTRNDGAEQIDGVFTLEGWHYIVECRWRERLADTRSVDGLPGQVQRSGKQTMGLFLSINGWSDNVCGTLKQNPQKCIVLMDGYDLRSVLALEADLREFLMAKLACLNLDAEPHLGAKSFLEQARLTTLKRGRPDAPTRSDSRGEAILNVRPHAAKTDACF